MPSLNKRIQLAEGEYYHIYNRGTDKRPLFLDEKDMARFIKSIRVFNTTRCILLCKRSTYEESEGVRHPPIRHHSKLVSIVAYNILPNHFHLLLKQEKEGGISKYIKKLQGGYTNYFNRKHGRSGVLFQGSYKYKHVDSDHYLRNIFCYITFNERIHKIPEHNRMFLKSSWSEYAHNKFNIVSKAEADFVLKSFGGLLEIKKYADRFIDIIKKQRSEQRSSSI